MLDRVGIKGGVYSSPDNATFVPGHVERTGENIATETTVLLYQTTGATFHCALPLIA